ncbi:hypothetical protein EW145_g5309 [Phellinidium pouzarii]|uniref:Class II aldolase/adducin N-terminal domain-containing protein n=1 Tax=Phellinidium pouzarii TaxID=167371 RepID=A0A4S4L1R5_9AGAM|nr:hypothetical protein EW145_g5309 [Phellinidium pouzarii]
MSSTGTITLTASHGSPPSTAALKQNVEGLAKNPLERTWRGNKEGTVRLQSVPDFAGDKFAERKWVKEHLAAAFRYWGKLGYGEGVSGHITVIDPVLPDHYWMNPFAVHFSSIKVSDLVLARPEIKAAAHCHSIHGKSWSVFGKPINILTQDSCLFYDNLGVYENFGGIVLAPQEGKNIAEALGPKFKTCILQNHGLLTLGKTVDEAVYLFSALENQCRAQLMVEAAAANGLKKRVIDNEDARFTASTIQFWENTYINFQPEYRLLLEETNGSFLK